jgi:hypothetical protein
MIGKEKALEVILAAGMFALLLPTQAVSVELTSEWQQIGNIPDCSYWFYRHKEKGSATWSGICVNGHVNGQGVLKTPDGYSIEGEFKDGMMNGYGILEKTGYVRYEGEFKDSSMHGQGIMIIEEGIRYEGEFTNGKPNGIGVLMVKDMYRYVGEFKNSDKDGFGIQDFPDGSRYEGQYLGDWRHGHGIWTLRDEKKCEGEWRKGELIGTGKGWVNGQARACVTEDYAVKFLD